MTDQLKRAINEAKTAQANDDGRAEATRIASSGTGDQNFDMSESSYKTSHTAVRKARRFAMQGLYEWLVTDRRFDLDGKLGWKANAPHDIAARTRATNAMHTVHIGYYHEMMRDIPEQIEALDALIAQHLDREIEKLDTVEHAILLIGAYELQNRLEIPYKVVLDEAMKLNNHFGATDAHKLINAVLDRMAIEIRAIEVQADTKANLRTSQKAATKQAQDAQAKSNENAIEANTDVESSPTAATKPRISANKTNVKRNRVNKTNAEAAETKKAVVNPDAKDSVDNDSVEDSVNLEGDSAKNNAVEDNAVENNAIESNVLENNVVEDEAIENTKDSDDIQLDDAASKSQD